METSQKLIIFGKYNGHCAYCGCKFKSMYDFRIDHIIPKSDGGKDEINNLNPSCQLCNHYKRAWKLETFRNALLAGVVVRLRKIYIFRVAEKYGMVEVHEWDKEFYYEKYARAKFVIKWDENQYVKSKDPESENPIITQSLGEALQFNTYGEAYDYLGKLNLFVSCKPTEFGYDIIAHGNEDIIEVIE